MLKIALKKNNRFYKIERYIIFIVSFILTYLTLMTSTISQKYNLNVGQIAKVDIKAPMDIVDEKATEQKIKDARDAVQDLYTKDNEVKITAVNNIKSLFNNLSALKDLTIPDKQKIDSLKQQSSIELSEDDLSALIKLSKDDITTLRDNLVDTITDLYDKTSIDDKSNDLNKAQTFVASKLNSTNLSSNIKAVAINIEYTQIKPNMFLDKDKTVQNKDEAERTVQKVIVRKDQTIVKSGEPVTEEQMQLLKNAGLLNEDSMSRWYVYVSLAMLILIIMILEWYYISRYYKEIFLDNRRLFLINIINLMSIFLARAVGIISPFFIPLACAPMLLTLLINYKISLVLSVMNVVLISGCTSFSVEITVIAALNAIFGAVMFRKMHDRNDIIFSSIFIAIINVVCTFSIGILLSNNFVEILKNSGYASIGSIASAVLTVGLSPFFESTFDIVTVIKLLELSNPNNPLLKRLLLEAPGTYYHSILVGNLAEVAADEVGANAVLTRVGAYYHDIGKIKRPYFFKENQMNMENPHNKIAPNLSALIITSHVKDGVELAESVKLPQSIIDIIEQHHGNSLVKYFYITMKNNSEHPEEIKEEDYRYQASIPSSKEAAIVMLADTIEAAVRSIADPDIDKIENMVNNLFKDKLNDGQLNDSDLTFKDIEKIKKAFLKTLNGMYHKRIEYPKENNAIKEKTDVIPKQSTEKISVE